MEDTTGGEVSSKCNATFSLQDVNGHTLPARGKYRKASALKSKSFACRISPTRESRVHNMMQPTWHIAQRHQE